MPYVTQEERERLKGMVDAIGNTEIGSPGSLNYLMTVLANKFLSEGQANYERYNAIVGVYEASKLEYYRRNIVPYEEGKIALNGDVCEFLDAPKL